MNNGEPAAAHIFAVLVEDVRLFFPKPLGIHRHRRTVFAGRTNGWHGDSSSLPVRSQRNHHEYCEMPAGLTGIVDSVDDLGQIHCHWENGSSLALIPGVDHFHQDMTQEPVIESSEEQEPDLEL